MSETAGKRNHLTFPERVKVLDVLRDVCVPLDGFAVYQAGFNDERVAVDLTNTLGRLVTAHNVAGIRSEMIGEIAPAKPADPMADLLARVAVLEEKVTAQAAKIVILETDLALADARLDALDAPDDDDPDFREVGEEAPLAGRISPRVPRVEEMASA